MQSSKKLATGSLSAFFCLLSLLLVACGGGAGPSTPSTGATKAPDNKQVYIYPDVGVADIKTFDPGLSTDLSSITAIDLVFTGLVQLDNDLKVQPQLAQSYQVQSDGVTWKFTLRPNLKFSDGTPLTSKDVAYSIDRALQPSLKSTVSPAYLNLVKDSDKLLGGKIKTIIGDSLMTPDDNTVVIVTNKKAAYFLDALTYSCSYVIEKSMIDKYGNKFADHLGEGIGGAGPFMVKSYKRGQEIDFVPNPNYYGPKVQLKELKYPFYKNTSTAYKAYQVGQVDDTGGLGIPSSQLAAARKLTRDFHQVPQLYINYYAMNYLTKPFDNIKIRQAFALAVNKDEIAHAVHKDTVIATNHIVPQGMPGYAESLTGPMGAPTAGDTNKAKQLFTQGLQEEGYASAAALPPITLTTSSNGDPDLRNEFAAVQQMWQTTLGVGVKINDIDFNKELDEITAATNNPKGIQFWSIAWIADYPDPQDWLTLQFDNGAQNNNVNYGQNKSADAAAQQKVQQDLEAADINANSTARLQQYNNDEQQLVNDVAWLPVSQVKLVIMHKPCAVGAQFNATGLTSPNDWAKLYISTDSSCANATVDV